MGPNDVEKRKFLTLPGLNSDPSVVQPVVSRILRHTSEIILEGPRKTVEDLKLV
jgi:hypothetical protein